MTHCSKHLAFPFLKASQLTATFSGGDITSDAGLLLVRQFDELIGFTPELSRVISDPRDPRFIQHAQVELLRQRLYQIVAGYEDCNDASRLRQDALFKAIAGRTPEQEPLGSQPTLSRLENRVGPDTLAELIDAQVRLFIRTRPQPLTEITLDLDPSEAPTFGDQQQTYFNGFYDTYMYFPNFLCDAKTGFLLAPVLRAGNAAPAQGAVWILARVVGLLRAAWPHIRIYFRADSSFAVPDLLEWLAVESIPYVIGMAENDVLKRLSHDFVSGLTAAFEQDRIARKCFTTFRYQAKTWAHPLRMVVKCEVKALGVNVRYVISTRAGRSVDLYTWYTQRGGTIERVIGQLKNGFEGDRLSCHRFEANAFRLLLHASAYNLMILFREHAAIPELQTADIQTLRIKLIKVGARVERTVRRLWVKLSSTWPFAELFKRVHATLVPHPGG